MAGKLYWHQIIFDAGNFMVVRNRCDLGVKQFSQWAQWLRRGRNVSE
jgi:hypothetical protein